MLLLKAACMHAVMTQSLVSKLTNFEHYEHFRISINTGGKNYHAARATIRKLGYTNRISQNLSSDTSTRKAEMILKLMMSSLLYHLHVPACPVLC